jgi:predicted methyltransferase
MKTPLKYATAAIAFAFAAACAGTPPALSDAALAIDYAAIVDTPDRPGGDIVSDGARRPAEVLALFAPQPGDTILEMEAGAGYYTELLSRTVGPDGKVYMQNPAGFDSFLGDAVSKRLDGRLTNVTYEKSNFDAFSLADGEADIVTWFQGPHELWYVPEGSPDGATDVFGAPDAVFAEISRVLRSGGQFVVIDHVAPAGSPPSTGGDTHRIDPAIVKGYAEAAGFTLETSSGMLNNPDDDGTKNVFDPEIRGKTSQAVLIFRKP